MSQERSRRWWPMALWAILLVGYTVASGFTLPPQAGVADPNSDEAMDTGQLAGLLSSSTTGVDVYALTPALASHTEADLLVVVAPERGPYPAEIDAIDELLDRGGNLLLFTTNEVWNPVTQPHGITVNGQLLIPAANASADRLVTVELPENLGGGTLRLPNASAMARDTGPGVEAVTSDQELIRDDDGDGRIAPGNDTAGNFPVVAHTQVGQGRLVVITSTEAVLNGPGFDRNLLSGLTSLIEALGVQGPVALDAGTHPRGAQDVVRAPAQASLALAHWSPIASGLLLIAAIGLVVQLPRQGGQSQEGPDLDDTTPHTREVSQRGRDRS